jgi:hypothetical protein
VLCTYHASHEMQSTACAASRRSALAYLVAAPASQAIAQEESAQISSFAVPLTVAGARGAISADAIGAFKETQGKRARLRVHRADLPLHALRKADADAVALPDWALAPALERQLAQPIPSPLSAFAYEQMPSGWHTLSHMISNGAAVPHRWTVLGISSSRSALRGKTVRHWSDLLSSRLHGRVALPASWPELVAIALRICGWSFSFFPKSKSAQEEVVQALEALLRSALVFGESEGIRALAANDAHAAVAPVDGLEAIAERCAGTYTTIPYAGTTLRIECWAAPARKAAISPTLSQWLAICAASTRPASLRSGGATADADIVPETARLSVLSNRNAKSSKVSRNTTHSSSGSNLHSSSSNSIAVQSDKSETSEAVDRESNLERAHGAECISALLHAGSASVLTASSIAASAALRAGYPLHARTKEGLH